MLSVVLRPEAAEELAEAHYWYDECYVGLGDEFVRCVEAVFDSARERPQLYPKVKGEIRRALVRRFPYAVFYVVEDETVLVLAVFHVSRDPADWQSRD